MDDDKPASVFFGFFFLNHVTRGHAIQCSFNCKCSSTWLKVCYKSAAIIFQSSALLKIKDIYIYIYLGDISCRADMNMRDWSMSATML